MEITSLSFPLVWRSSVPPSNPKCSLLIGSAGHGVWRMEVAQQCVLCSSWQLRWDHARQRALIAEWRRSLPGWGLVGSSQRGVRTENGSSCVRKQRCAGNHQLLCSNGSCVGVEGVARSAGGRRLSGMWAALLWGVGQQGVLQHSRLGAPGTQWVQCCLGKKPRLCSVQLWRSVTCKARLVLPRARGQHTPLSRVQWSAGFSSTHCSPSQPYWSTTLIAWQWARVGSAPLCSSVGRRFSSLPRCAELQCDLVGSAAPELLSQQCWSTAGALPAAAGGLQMCPTKLHLLPNYNRSGAPPGTPRAASF